MKILSVFFLCAGLSGCLSFGQAIMVAGSAVSVVCNSTTKESRAEIRDKQKLQTDFCGDLPEGK